MEDIATRVIAAMVGVPAIWIYLVTAVWMGIECLGIGLPTEPVMLFVGSLVAQGHVNVALALIGAGLGCILFGSLAYTVGDRYGTKAIGRYGRFIGLPATRAAHLELWLRHRGVLGVIGLRMLPFVRSFSSFVSGVADVPLAGFAVGTFVGSVLYFVPWIILGDVFGARYRVPLHALDEFGAKGIAAVVGALVLLFLLHHFTGRLALRGLAAHFHRHRSQHEHKLATVALL
ncbi:MAG TPA: DedA family protein [Ktedonobacterales bacterium]